MKIIQKIISIAGETNVKLNEPMSNHTTFKIGGPADIFVTPETKEALLEIIGFCKTENIPVTVVGNIYRGLVFVSIQPVFAFWLGHSTHYI